VAVVIEAPHPTLPLTYVPPGGVPYRVRNGDNWISIAQRLGLEPKSLIFFNYLTTEPKYVNYYLKHNVGCKVVSPDGKNYSFTDAYPGIIYLPSSSSNFHYINEPIVTEFNTPKGSRRFELVDDPANPGTQWLLRAKFSVNVRFNKRLPDVTPYAYRQYIKGRVRVRFTLSSKWHDIKPINVPAHKPGTDWTVGTPMPIQPHTWMEDGKLGKGGKVLRYGYREARPYFVERNAEADYYRDPITATPPQTGYEYIGMDEPTTGWYYLHKVSGHDPFTLNGVSAEVYFKGEVVEWKDFRIVSVLRTQYWDVQGHFEILSRPPANALTYREIDKPA
jgi:hypothetical protein